MLGLGTEAGQTFHHTVVKPGSQEHVRIKSDGQCVWRTWPTERRPVSGHSEDSWLHRPTMMRLMSSVLLCILFRKLTLLAWSGGMLRD